MGEAIGALSAPSAMSDGRRISAILGRASYDLRRANAGIATKVASAAAIIAAAVKPPTFWRGRASPMVSTTKPAATMSALVQMARPTRNDEYEAAWTSVACEGLSLPGGAFHAARRWTA